VPELPEVETVRRGLTASLLGARIATVDMLWRPAVAAPDDVIDALAGRRLVAIRRRGKALIVHLDRDLHLLVHLKMTGQLVVVRRGVTVFAGGHPSRSMLDAMPNATTRVVIGLTGGTQVFFNDQRKFGWIRVLDASALQADPFLARLGPEPLDDEFTVVGFRARLAAHAHAMVKAVLLDQSTLAGLGNIYTDESLHLARIHPRRLCGNLSRQETARLHAAIKTTLRRAVEHGGTSFADYVNAFRGHGSYLAQARVFGRVGRPCPACGTRIERIRVAGRGTNLCRRCQPLC
jgi:formamidopyrimidine-DNA glycosylase